MLRHLLLGGLLAAPLLATAPASAATQLGTSPDVALPTTAQFACAPAASCTVAQERLSNVALRVPSLDGAQRAVVVGWRLHGEGGQVRLRRVGGGGTAASPLPAALGVHAMAAQLPVSAGDLLAVDLLDGARLSREPSVTDADGQQTWTPALGDGETRAASESFQGYLLVQADLEPDKDADGLGDETQDPDRGATNPPPVDRGPAPPLDRGAEPPVRAGPPADPYAGLPAAGPRVTIAGSATATRRGAVALTLTNPYGFALKGRLALKQGRRAAGSASVALSASAVRTVTVRLPRAVRAALARAGRLKLTAVVTLRAPVGRARTTTRTLTAKLAGAGGRRAPRAAPRAPVRDAPRGGDGFDGTYRAADGQTMVVENGRVLSFNGSLTLYCTRSGRQKLASYGMVADDPDPVVGADGGYAWEATRGYGFEKLTFDGTIRGDVASGRLVVEDRSPLLGSGRIEFDYCFAGKQYSLKR